MSIQPSVGDVPKAIPDNHSRFLTALKRSVEMFSGQRGPDGEQAIVKGDIVIADLPTPTADYVSGTPTQAQFNALVDDVATLRSTFNYLLGKMR